MQYYTLLECPECGKENFILGVNLLKHKGKPAFDPTMFSQEYTYCDECGISFGTGDVEIFSENDV